MQLCYLETFWSFQFLLLRFFKVIQCQSRAKYCSLLRPETSVHSTQCPLKSDVIQSHGGGGTNRHYPQALLLLLFLGGPFSRLGRFLHSCTDQYSAEHLRGTLWSSLEFSLWIVLSSSVVFSVNSRYCYSPNSQFHHLSSGSS